MLQRTQLMLDSELKRDLEMLAEYKNQSMSQLVREFVAEKVEEEKKTVKKVKKISAIQSMMNMVKAAKKYKMRGPKDLAQRHDKYIY